MRVKHILLLIFLLSILMLLPTLRRLEPLVVLSGSMEPLFNPGDIVVIERIPPEEVSVGDVIAFHPPKAKDEKTVVTHRVVEVLTENGSLRFQTKGDNNEEKDPFIVPAENVVGKAVFSLPYVGYLTRYNPEKRAKLLVYLFLILIPGIALLYSELSYLLRYSPRVERAEERLRIWRSRTVDVIDLRKLGAVFFLSLIVFTALFHPSIERNGDKAVNRGFLPLVLLRDDVPDYVYLGQDDSYDGKYELAVNSVLPVMWLVRAYEVNPFILKTLNVILSILLTLITFPIWVGEFPNVNRRKRRRRHGALGV